MGRHTDMELRVLGASGAEGREWAERVALLPPDQQDLHFLPQYARIYERTYGFRPQLAVYGDDSRYLLQPFVERPLNSLPFLASTRIADVFVDIANPYGYGGPALRTRSEADAGDLLQRFEQDFLAHCRSKGYAAEFASLHPRLGNATRLGSYTSVSPVRQKDVVYIDLEGGPDALWRALRKGHKSSIGKARRSGAVVERIVPTVDDLRMFEALYVQTMRRNQAHDRWYFPEGYFSYCLEELGDEGASLFFVRMGGAVVAASILIHAFDTAYYHFSGSDASYNEFGVGTQLVFEMACWASARGYRWMHLGGGVTAAHDDPLYRFKSGFSALRAELMSYGRVLHDATYQRLCEIKREFELATQGRMTESDFFPMYRR